MNSEQLQALEKLREMYGNNFQLMVCIEELNELACVLCKYPRYDNPEDAIHELRSKVLGEYADVVIILNHIRNIFNLSEKDIETYIEAKMERVYRWVDSDNHTPQQTLIDREVKTDVDSTGV